MISTLSPWIVIPASALIVTSGVLVLIASIGMVRATSFLPRTHIQAIIYSTSLWALLLASLLLTFSLKDRTFLHEILIGLFIFITSPVSTILLARSFVLREERASLAAQKSAIAAGAVSDKQETDNERVAADDVASIEAHLEIEPEPDTETDLEANSSAEEHSAADAKTDNKDTPAT